MVLLMLAMRHTLPAVELRGRFSAQWALGLAWLALESILGMAAYGIALLMFQVVRFSEIRRLSHF
jgi:hypothetical protein